MLSFSPKKFFACEVSWIMTRLRASGMSERDITDTAKVWMPNSAAANVSYESLRCYT